jgi:hypothetical protein
MERVVSFTHQDSSFVVRIRLIPAKKKMIPMIPNMINDFTSRVPPDVLTNNTAAYIKPAIPRRVSKAPKILLTFIIIVFLMA